MRNNAILTTLCAVVVGTILLGCAAVRSSVQDYESCMQDVECRQKVEAARVIAEASTIAAVQPIPVFSQPVGTLLASLISGIVSFVTGAVMGARKRGV